MSERCACRQYIAPPITHEDVRERMKHDREIAATLQFIKSDSDKWMAVHRCGVYCRRHHFEQIRGYTYGSDA